MADNKLAAGRKMLLEFQKRKTDKKHTSTTDSTLAVGTPSMPDSAPTIEPPPMHNAMEPINNVHFTTQEFVQVGQNPPDLFFDEFSNRHQQNVTTESGLPLAGRLFTFQNNGQNTLDFPPESNIHTNEYDNIQKNDSSFQNIEMQHSANSATNHEEVQDLRTMVEMSKLQQQLQFHIKTVEFLVTEKNNLTEKVNDCEKIIDDLKTQTTDLTGRLNISRHRVSHLETECSQLKQKNEEAERQIQKLLHESTNRQSIENTYKKQLQDVQEELQEMKTLMDDKVSDYKLLLKRFEEVNTQLQSNELRLQQVIQGDGQTSQNASIQEHCQNLEQMINALRQQLSQAESEKNHSSLHYQQYVQQLNNQIQMLNEKQEELINENEKLQNREESLLQQMGSLEKQLQTTFSQNVPQETNDKNNVQLNEKIQALEMEVSRLQVELQNSKSSLEASSQEINKKQEEIEELTSTLQRIQSESPDVTKLNAAMESDRLAAQKATAQNTKMKIDLQHLEKAFEQMTNSKLELAELLQAEKNMSKNLTMTLVETEEKLKDVESKLMAKDEEMIRLQSASSELEKDILKYAQITDRISHYEAQGKSLDSIQTELQSAKNTIQTLSNENEKLKKRFVQTNNKVDESDNNDEEQTTHNVDVGELQENSNSDEVITSIPTADAMNKLQEKFTKLIKEVADLSDEKQKLEHIVLQLQGETETICEYIALYQKQRSILKQREAERNAQLNMLATERENMKCQLESLKALILQLHNRLSNSNVTNQDDNTTLISKIMDVVAEIKGNHLIEPNDRCSNLDNFHHCPWCSGKLITV